MHANEPRRRPAFPAGSRTARGFTLIEVLAALAIIALGMLGVIEAVSQTASHRAYLREKTIAHWVAMNRLTEVRLEPRAPKIDETSAEVEMAGQRWRWTMEVSETPVETLRRIDIRVGRADGNRKASLASVTGFYGSAITPAGMSPSVWQLTPGQNVPPGQEPEAGPPTGDTPEGGEPVDPSQDAPETTE